MTNIVLLSDGTGNSAAKVWRTNVWRLFQSLELKGSGQIAIYDDGVGTSSFLPLAILGGAFGWGLKRNVRELYKFLCRNYRDGDRIYGFGFSRGAFTIRVLIGLVLNQGLVKFTTEAELDKKAKAAYRAYRHARYPAWNLQYPYRLIRTLLDRRFYTPCERPVDQIEFLGLWDTVAAYGLPIDEMTRGVNNWIWPLELPSTEFDRRILKARHALAIDDERETFFPVLWDEDPTNTRPSGADRPTKDEQLLQVWFTGMHANVGGGYPDDALANVSLSWILAEAQQAGLVFKEMANAEPDALLTTDSAKDKDGRLYDSRSGLGGYYRYSPRKIATFYEKMPEAIKRKKAAKAGSLAQSSAPALLPKIHETVFGRIKTGAHFYAPIGLPGQYEIVTTGNVSVAYTLPPNVMPAAMSISPNTPSVAEGTGSVIRYKDQQSIWDMVWRKRGVYFLTVFTSIYLVAYPLFRDTYAYEEARTRLHLVSDTVRLLGSFLPAFAKRWLDSYAEEPGWFLVILLLVISLTWLGSSLAASIKNQMRPVWVTSLPGTNPAPATAPTMFNNSQGNIVAAIAGMLLIFYPLFGDLLPWPVALETVRDFLAAYVGPPINVVLGLTLVACFLPSTWVRGLREWPVYQGTLQFFKNRLAPLLSALAIVLLATELVCHFGFNTLDGFGWVCHENPSLNADKDSNGFENGQVTVPFDIASPNRCTSIGVFLTRGRSYSIEVTRDPPAKEWSFFGEPAYMGDQPLSRLPWYKKLTMAILFPLRRVFDRPWGSLILRTGGLGTEVNYLDRDPPPESDDFRRDVNQSAIPSDGEQLSEPLRATRSGELFVYANKPVIGWLSNWIGATGKATIKIRQK